MLDRAAKATNWEPTDLAPPESIDDIEIVEWSTESDFRRERAAWVRDINRMGHIKYANMQVLASVIAGYMGAKDGAAFPSLDTLVADLGWSKMSVRRALDPLVEWGWLRKVRRPNNSSVLRMSYSPTVRLACRQRYEERKAQLDASRAQKKAANLPKSAAAGVSRPEHTECPDENTRNDQTRTPGVSRPEQLSYPRSSLADPIHLSPIELGETEPGTEAEDTVQKKADREDVIMALGLGNTEEGERLAAYISPARLLFIVQRAEAHGLRSVAEDIRRAAADAEDLADRRAAS